MIKSGMFKKVTMWRANPRDYSRMWFILIVCVWAVSLTAPATAQLDRFGPQQELTSDSTNGPESVFAMDLDGDGDADVLSASRYDDKIAWYENRLTEPEGDFGPQQVISTDAGWAKSVFAVDLDGDGDADVLSASYSDDKIAWYENRLRDTEADFGPKQVITTDADGAKFVFAIDLDGDGDADVLSASYNDDKIAWYENRLTEAERDFGPQQVISTDVDRAESVFATDLDGDGDADVLSASDYDSKITWYENRLTEAEGDFGPQQVITAKADWAKSVFAIDVDGDGDADVLSASTDDDKIAWYENRLSEAEGDFGPEQVITTDADGAASVFAIDLDGDGDADVLSASLYDDKIAWYENRLSEAEGDFGPEQVITTDADGAWSVFATDVDGDGDAEVLSASSRDNKIAWYENRLTEAEGDFGPQQVITTDADGATSVFAVDLDGDGDADVLSAFKGDDKIAWYENRLLEAEGDLGTRQVITTDAEGAYSVFAMDLDGDGDADVLSSSSSDDKIAWYENRLSEAEGDFGPQQVITTDANEVLSVFAMDLDGDGDAEVLSASSADSKIAWYENRLTEVEGNFGSQQVITTNADGASSVFAMDLDGDGDADVLSASTNDDKIAWYENRLSEAEGDFGPQQVISTDVDGAESVFAIDLDGDGDADVLSASVYFYSPHDLLFLPIDKIAWYENRLSEAEGDFGPQQVISTDVDWAASVFAIDVDGDGDADVLSASRRGEEIAWYENRLAESEADFGPQQVITTDADGANSVFAMDLDGDGDADVLSASADDDKIAWYENIGSIFALRSEQGWESAFVDSLVSPDFSHDEDEESLLIKTITNDSLYGLWESPSVSIDPAEEASVLRTRWRLSSSIDPPRYVPTIRLRTSTEDFSRSDLLVATSAGPGIFSPRYYDTDYTQYSIQPLAPQDYRFSFEMLNVDPTDAAEGSVSLHYLQIDQLAQSRLGNSQVVLDHNFETATGASFGWESYSDFSNTFPAPEEFTDQNGLLIRGVVPSSERVPFYELLQFGYWNTQTDLPLLAGKIYRARYTVASDATEAERAFVPTFRLRASDSSFMMGHVVNIDSVNAETNIPLAGQDVTYDLWFLCPEAVDGNYLNLSFDYLYVEKDTPDADDPTIALTLKRVEVEEWGK